MGTFIDLSNVNVNDHLEQKNGLNYLSWAWAWSVFKKKCLDANYTIWKDEQGRPYIYDENLGYMVFVSVTADGETHEMWLPVMDSGNNAMKSQPYTKQTKYKSFEVNAATMFDINTAIMRCLVKCIGMFGLGLYIYAGEDLPKAQATDPIDKNKVKVLEMMCEELNISAEGLCKLYKVKNLESFTEEMFANAVTHKAEIAERAEFK